jgi:hypothetical protein
MSILIAAMPPSSLFEKSIAGMIGYAGLLYLACRIRQPSSLMRYGVGPVATILAVALFHSRQGSFGNGDLGYAFLFGIIAAAAVGGLSAFRTDRPTARDLWIISGTLFTIVAAIAAWLGMTRSEFRYGDDWVANAISAIAIFSGLSVVAALAVLHSLRPPSRRK